MQAELEQDVTIRAELLANSRRLLEEAYPAFDELLAHNNRFVKDRGECVSLLARTHAVTPDLAAARAAVTRAERLLAPVTGSKAAADLVILRAELDAVDLLNAQAEADSATAAQGLGDATVTSATQTVRDRLVEIAEVVEAYTNQPAVGHDLGASEIVARAELTAGLLHERLGQRVLAREAYERAANLYDRLRYPGASGNARWAALQLSDRPVPQGLLDAFDRLDADPGARVVAIQHLTESAGTSTEGGHSHPGPEDVNYWNGVANWGITDQAARTAPWDEGRKLA
jgi:tetratricopeptide (TPR) repeat protein